MDHPSLDRCSGDGVDVLFDGFPRTSDQATGLDQVLATSGRQVGAVVLFDEYYNFPRWQQHEYKAFQEFVARTGVKYEYIAYSVTGQQVAVRILENPIYSD